MFTVECKKHLLKEKMFFVLDKLYFPHTDIIIKIAKIVNIISLMFKSGMHFNRLLSA